MDSSQEQERMKAQIQEMLSEDNKWFAGEFYRHQPSDSEAALYYIVVIGEAAKFAERWKTSHQDTVG